MYRQARVTNVPEKPREVYDYARAHAFTTLIDEKNSVTNPNFYRQPSNLSYDEAFKFIEENKPHWVISFRHASYLSTEEDYWEFAGCSISGNDYGDVFIFIKVLPETAREIFEKFSLEYEEY